MAAADIAATMLMPNGTRTAQQLGNSGTTESTNATALPIGRMATLKNGPVAIFVKFLTATGGGSAVTSASRDIELGPYERWDWDVEDGNEFVAIEAADGSSAYRATVWTSSGTK